MSSLLKLFSLLSAASAVCKVGNDEKRKDNKHHSTTICPELCLMEPGCKNEILSKFNIGLFVLDHHTMSSCTSSSCSSSSSSTSESESVTSTTTSSTHHEDSSSDDDRERLCPLKILKFHERRDGCCTTNSIVISFIKPLLRPVHDCAFLIISPKSDYCHNVPHIFATTFSNSSGVDQKIVGHNHQVVYKIPLKDIENLIVSITDLGIANAGSFKRSHDSLDLVLESDIFTHGPLVTNVPHFKKKYCLPEDYKLPNNMMLRLGSIHKDLKESMRHPTVPRFDITKMAVAAFINEIRFLFNCPKPVEKCEQLYCEQKVSDYCLFVTSCVKAIAYCEEKAEAQCHFVKPAHCSEQNLYSGVCHGINTFASKCQLTNVTLNTEIQTWFSEICPLVEFKPEEDCLKLNPIDAEEECELSAEVNKEMLNNKKAALAKKKPAVAVKTTTSVSTYGWYVAGGVVAVSVAVAVYVFAF